MSSTAIAQTPSTSTVVSGGSRLRQQQQHPQPRTGNEAPPSAVESSFSSMMATSGIMRRPPAVQQVANCVVDEAEQRRTGSVHCCTGCRHPIRDQYVLHVDPDLNWHAQCLRCSECLRPLDETCTCFVRDGRPYCKPDYTR